MCKERFVVTDDRLIICEGPHDRHFLECLIVERSLGSFQIRTAEEAGGGPGKDGFGPALDGLNVAKNFDRLKGIAIVTDNDKAEALSDLEKTLIKYGYTVITPTATGKIYDKAVIMVPLPDESNCGDLEKLCLPALYEKWPKAKECVAAYFKCAETLEWEKKQRLYKAEVRCIISAFYERDPYKGLGYLFRDNKELARHGCFNKLVSILKSFDETVTSIRLQGEES